MAKFSVSVKRLVISFDTRPLAAGIVLFVLLVNLGVWQLDRAQEKSALQARWLAQSILPPVAPAMLTANSEPEFAADRLVTWTGEFIPEKYILLDNRLHRGQPGYHVVALVRVGTIIVPLNLGWISSGGSRDAIPPVALPKGEVSIAGRIYVPTSKPFMMQEQFPPKALPAIVQTLYWDNWNATLSLLTGGPMFPYEVRIDPQSPHALVANWPVVNQSPAKHYGYALQWFIMAGLLVLIGLFQTTNLKTLITRNERL